MDLNDALRFLRANHRSVLVTRKRNGDPQLSPVNHGVDDQGRVVHLQPGAGLQGPQPPPGSPGQPARPQRRLLRRVGAGRRHRRADLAARRHGAARRPLPADPGRAPRLGRLPGRHGARPAVDHRHHADRGRPGPGRLSTADRATMARPSRAIPVAAGRRPACPRPGLDQPGTPDPAGARAGVQRPAVGRSGDTPGRRRSPGRRRRPARSRPVRQARQRLRLRHPDRRPAGRAGRPGLASAIAAPWLAGQSWGANVVLELAARHPDAAAGLVLVDGGTMELAEPVCRLADLRGCPGPAAARRHQRGQLRAADPQPPPRLAGERDRRRRWPTSRCWPDGTIRPWLSRRQPHDDPAPHVGPPPVRRATRWSRSPVLLVPAEDGANQRWMAASVTRWPGPARPWSGR